MKKPLATISEKLNYLLSEAVSMVGTFQSDEVLLCIEESLTLTEHNHCSAFLTWLNDNGKTFGRNLPDVWKEWTKSVVK